MPFTISILFFLNSRSLKFSRQQDAIFTQSHQKRTIEEPGLLTALTPIDCPTPQLDAGQ
jgi:hypothetical protein